MKGAWRRPSTSGGGSWKFMQDLSKERKREMERKKGSRSSSWVLMFSLGLALVAVCNVRMVVGVKPSQSQCKEERRIGTSVCKPVVFGQPASPACCERIRVSHFECVCPYVTPKFAALLDVNRVIKLLQGCGRRVPRHFKCGSLNFP